MAKTITVGRSPECDIRLGQECAYASGNHASIFVNGSQIVYQDTSRNGTYINGRLIRNQAVAISGNDRIMLAGRYPLEWNRIAPFFQGSSTMYESAQDNSTRFDVYQNGHPSYQQQARMEVKPQFGWNWGAFSLYPIWGFWNGCWWSILVWLFFGWSIIPNILYGAMGSKWAWRNKEWNSIDEFNQMQDDWKPWGIAVFVINIVSVIFIWVLWSSIFVTLFESLLYL